MSAAKKTIHVISTSVIREGEGAKGHWALSEVTATTPTGEPILEQLKTFDHLQVGPVEVEVEKQEHEKYGTSYMLRRAGGSRGGGASSGGGSGLAQQVAELRKRVEILEHRLGQLAAPGAAPAPAEPTPARSGWMDEPAAPPAPTPPQADGAARFGGDDDIPF